MTVAPAVPTPFGDHLRLVVEETSRLLDGVVPGDWENAGARLRGARSVFAIGSGRSGLAIRMAAMRLMHLGLRVHVAGEATAPAIGAGDVLVAVSGSGTTSAVVNAAETARKVGASVIAVTTAAESLLAREADDVLLLAGADKQDHSGSVSRQYAGSLFEQAVLLAFDALFEALRSSDGQTPQELWERHANLG
ncbi:6-phospho-3-hexuloisomerase [Nocardioides sp. NPDC127514]|uniref:6-phospho-3-hexuloisomerase n=1 Tax=unclassified Nocardioides TaxID=2615069 RepID=UPI00332F5096